MFFSFSLLQHRFGRGLVNDEGIEVAPVQRRRDRQHLVCARRDADHPLALAQLVRGQRDKARIEGEIGNRTVFADEMSEEFAHHAGANQHLAVGFGDRMQVVIA